MCYTGNPTCTYRGDGPHECHWTSGALAARRAYEATIPRWQPVRRITSERILRVDARHLSEDVEHARTAAQWRAASDRALQLSQDCAAMAGALSPQDGAA